MLSTRFTILFILGCMVMVGGMFGIHQYERTHVEPYPSRPIKFIVPATAGSSIDLVPRLMERSFLKNFKQQLVVTNIPGGGGTIGYNELAGAKPNMASPDGYTIGITGNDVFLQPYFGRTRYHYPTALDPLAQICPIPFVVVVNSNQPWTTMDDLIKYAKDHPGEIKYGHQGIGSTPHIMGEMFAKKTGINIVPVPFNGGSEVLTALLGGHVQLMFTSPPAIKGHVDGGTIRMLAVADDHRLTTPGFQQVPTLKEQGIDLAFGGFFCVAAPKMLPKDVKKKLSEMLEVAINDPDFKELMENAGLTVEYLGPEECTYKWIEENRRLTKILEETGIAELVAKQKN